MDAYKNALQQYDENNRKIDLALERFEAFVTDELKAIDELITFIRNVAKDFEGFDFSEEANDMLREIV